MGCFFIVDQTVFIAGPSSGMAQISPRRAWNFFPTPSRASHANKDAAARLKKGSCETMTLPGDTARCRAVLWGTELEFWGEGFGEFWGDAFDGEDVIDGADGGFASGLYDAFGEFFADTGE